MSEDFDKEAERERLREKFAQEEADRASAKQMSELLLQGVTMTDRHCPECGAPLFRDGDRVFCPSCERDVAPGEAEEPPATPDATDTPDPAEEADATTDDPTAQDRPTAPSGTPRDHVQRALERSTAAAAGADDPRAMREYLEAATAALETLDAMDEA